MGSKLILRAIVGPVLHGRLQIQGRALTANFHNLILLDGMDHIELQREFRSLLTEIIVMIKQLLVCQIVVAIAKHTGQQA